MAQSAAAIIAAFNDGREPERLALKTAAMRDNVFSFFRGTAHLFWQRCDEAAVDATAPAAWCSGDLHLENFGTYLADNNVAYFDVNDFDEAAKAPCDWEILRLLASIAVAAPSLKIGKPDAKALMRSAADAYGNALQAGKARWVEKGTSAGAIGQLMAELKSRGRVRLLDRRTQKVKGVRRLDVPSAHMLPINESVRAQLAAFTKSLGKDFAKPDYFVFLDAARRIAGTGSLGLERYSVLIEGDGSPDGNVLLDLKAAKPSSLAMWTKVKQPSWASEAERVVSIQQRCQAIAPHLLHAVTFSGQPIVLKELQPSADRLDLAGIAKEKNGLSEAVQTMGQLAGWGQLRSAGRDGSATPDALMAFARDGGLVERWIVTARQLADQTLIDYADYCRAYDAGAAAKPAKKT